MDSETNIRDITDGFFYELDEIICVKCGYRWIAARPEGTLLKHLECPKGHVGFAILTGEDIDRVYDSEKKEVRDADKIIKTDECRIVAHEKSAERILPFKELQKQRCP
jgi:hypothetical protein